MNFLTEVLAKKHVKEGFSCGKPMLDNYLHHQSSQDVKRKLSACFVLPDPENMFIKAWYTLSSFSVKLETLPGKARKRLPPAYESIPATLLGRLAVDRSYQKQGLAKLMLIDALRRSYEASKSVASYAVVVDPMDEEARDFYLRYGFIGFPDSPRMFLAMKTIGMIHSLG